MRRKEEIVVIGYALNLPGAKDAKEYMENILSQRQTFRILPEKRLPKQEYYNENPDFEGTTYSPYISIITNWEFDYLKYRIPPKVAQHYDMTHWLALDTANKAIKNTFGNIDKINKEKTGIILGNSLAGEFSRSHYLRFRWPYIKKILDKTTETHTIENYKNFIKTFEQQYKKSLPEINEDSLAGGMSNLISSRIANYFDFQGGAYTVDGACSSSLLAVSDACRALENNEMEIVLTGGVDISLDPFEIVGFAKTKALATTEIKPYDNNSDGMLPGEGCVILILSKLKIAEKLGITPIATIKGWGISSDGKGLGITAPKKEGQKLAIKRAYQKAKYGIETVDYIEGHGTGTVLGDKTEISALKEVIESSKREKPIYLGSVKANIGHTKAASGAAGLLKAILCVQNKIIPTTTSCYEPNKAFGDLKKLRPSLETQNWNKQKRRASVSAMGFGGSNAHITIESFEETIISIPNLHKIIPSQQKTELLLFSADTEQELLNKVKKIYNIAKFMSFSEISDLAVKTQKENHKHKHRLSIVAKKPLDLLEKLNHIIEKLKNKKTITYPEIFYNTQINRIIFLYPGQGSQFIGMGYDLFKKNKTFAKICLNLLKNIKKSKKFLENFFLTTQLLTEQQKKEKTDKLKQTEISQPAITLISLALKQFLEQINIKSQLTIGHSLGEISAMSDAQIFSETTALKLAFLRGKTMKENATKGAMTALFTSPLQAEKIIAQTKNYSVIANYNAPTQQIISGTPEAIDEIEEICRKQKILYHRLEVSNAFHSKLLNKSTKAFLKEIEFLKTNKPTKKIISTITASQIEKENIKKLLSEQIINPVQFQKAIENANLTKNDLLIECGPGEVLTKLATTITKEQPQTISLIAKKQDTQTNLNKLIALLFASGKNIKTETITKQRTTKNIETEKYPPKIIENPCEKVFEQKTETKTYTRPQTPKYDKITEFAIDWIIEKTGFQKKDIKPEMKLRDDLNLDSIKTGELAFELGKKLNQEQQIGDPTIFADTTLKKMISEINKDNLKDFPKIKTTTTKKAIVLNNQHSAIINTYQSTFLLTPLKTTNKKTDEKYFIISDEKTKQAIKQANIKEETDQNKAKNIIIFGNNNKFSSISNKNFTQQFTSELKEDFEKIHKFLQKKDTIEDSFKLLYIQKTDNHFLSSNIEKDSLTALFKTLNLEYNKGYFKHININQALTNTQIAKIIKEELQDDTKEVSVYYDENKKRYTPKNIPTEQQKEQQIEENEQFLITGGAKGITFQMAYALAKKFKIKLILLGSTPKEKVFKNKEAKENFLKLEKNKIKYTYISADITNQEELKQQLNKIEKTSGKITGILHGAGINHYKLFKETTNQEFLKYIKVKIFGIYNILNILDITQIKHIHLISSVLAKTGMRNQSHYTFANSALDFLALNLKNKFPKKNILSLGYTVWKGTGMGERDNAINYLTKIGVEPINIETGIKTYIKLATTHAKNPLFTITGALTTDLEKVIFPQKQYKNLRFTEKILRHIPQAEIVSEANLTTQQDKYITHHQYNGTNILPAVISIEAMAQNASIISKHKHLSEIKNLQLIKPIITNPQTTIRIIAFITKQHLDKVEIKAEIYSQTDNFAQKAVEATITFTKQKPKQPKEKLNPEKLNPEKTINPDKYHPYPLFQGKFFRKIEQIYTLTSEECITKISNKKEKCFNKNTFETLAGNCSFRDSVLQTALLMIGKIELPTKIEKIKFYNTPKDFGYCKAEQNEIKIYNQNLELIEHIQGLKTVEVDQNNIETKLQQIENEINSTTKKFILKIETHQPFEKLKTKITFKEYEYAKEKYGEKRFKTGINNIHISKKTVVAYLKQHKITSKEITIKHKKTGQPYIENFENIYLTISDKENITATAVSQNKIGIDLEIKENTQTTPKTPFLEKEQQQLEKLTRFTKEENSQLTLWTIKEALKKIGKTIENFNKIEKNLKTIEITQNTTKTYTTITQIENKTFILTIAIALT